MKKVIVIGLVIILAGVIMGVDRAGRTDSFTRSDVIHSVYERGWGFTSTPYKYVDSASVRDAVDEMDIAISIEFKDACVRWDTIATTANTHRYSLNTDCIEPLFVWVKDGGTSGDGDAMQKIDPNDWGYNTSIGDPLPKQWTFVGGSGTKLLLVDPVPSTADTLIIMYRALSNSMAADTTTSNISIKYYELLVLRTLIFLMENNEGTKVDRVYAHAKDREAILMKQYEGDRVGTIKPDIK